MVLPSTLTCGLTALLPILVAGYHSQKPIQPERSFIDTSIYRPQPDLLETLADPTQHIHDEFTQDIPYEGIAYFAHLNGSNCFSTASDGTFDIGIVGAPFDLGVTYRPGARFGPAGTRMGSRRLSPSMAYR
jgi:agmatinase